MKKLGLNLVMKLALLGWSLLPLLLQPCWLKLQHGFPTHCHITDDLHANVPVYALLLHHAILVCNAAFCLDFEHTRSAPGLKLVVHIEQIEHAGNWPRRSRCWSGPCCRQCSHSSCDRGSLSPLHSYCLMGRERQERENAKTASAAHYEITSWRRHLI